MECVDTGSDPELSTWAVIHRTQIDLTHAHILDLHRMLHDSGLSRPNPIVEFMEFGVVTIANQRRNVRQPKHRSLDM